MKIVLIGFMGSGKTSVAAILADHFKFKLVEQDQEIISISNRKSINDIFEHEGEVYFRDLEHSVLKKVLTSDNFVLSTGGGVIEREPNRRLLIQANAKVVYLQTSFEVIETRISGDERPLFKDPKKAIALYHHRQALYEDIANITVDTDEFSVEEVAQQVIKLIGA